MYYPMLRILATRIQKLNSITFVLIVVAFHFAVSFLYGGLVTAITGRHIGKELNDMLNVKSDWLIIIFFGPIAETLLFVCSVFSLGKKYLSDFWLVLLSGVLFGIAHYYNIYYIISATLTGILFASIYVMKGKLLNAFAIVSSI